MAQQPILIQVEHLYFDALEVRALDPTLHIATC
jgi:hypothetical protein